MAPYDPPSAHYAQMDVSMYDDNTMFEFIGKGGRRFYWLTKFLGLDYIWYDKERQVIELWGPFECLENFQSEFVIRCEIEHLSQKRKHRCVSQDDDPSKNSNLREVVVV